MDGNKLPEFASVEELVDFFDTHDMGEYDLPVVQFDVDIQRRTFLLAVDKELMMKLARAAKAHNTSTEKLVNAWLEERVTEAA